MTEEQNIYAYMFIIAYKPCNRPQTKYVQYFIESIQAANIIKSRQVLFNFGSKITERDKWWQEVSSTLSWYLERNQI